MNRRTPTRSLFALASFAAAAIGSGLDAQAQPPFSGLLPHKTFPSDHAPDLTPTQEKLTDGSTYSDFAPFSHGKSRMMFVFDKHDMTVPDTRQILHVGYQREGTLKSKGYGVQMRVLMGPAKTTSKSASTTYADNYDATPISVFGGTTGKILALPDLGDSLSPNVDRPFVWVPLDVPYTHDATRGLVLDYHVNANANSSTRWPYYLDRATFDSPIQAPVLGCVDSGNKIPKLTSSPTAIGDNWYLRLTNAPGSSVAATLISLAPAATPFPLNPARPECRIGLDVGPAALLPVLFTGTTDSGGRYTWNFAVPDLLFYNDKHLYSQTLIPDLFAPQGFTLSNTDDIQIGMDPQMSMIYSQGIPSSLTIGYLSKNYGLITHFRHN
jgi:hypothetical protein